ncbi:hypothetical protein GCM10010329_51270 [Streptomyces spiroverticillatus]|uniref:Uncharacterized protein n=1 Tax=Streptomyces finlayi TaxID=67296 RepID=A0A918X1L1_9ACTN|nr:hypothetical protein GCM10010329_51270 [Streptomyces spiroverticillatus]GHD03977.1 hypothetical protein GCM10010334_52210 [Streptomyces finlayi]
MGAHRFDGPGPVGGLGDDLDERVPGQDRPDPGPDHRFVVRDQYVNHRRIVALRDFRPTPLTKVKGLVTDLRTMQWRTQGT